jgi:hypothetical protein
MVNRRMNWHGVVVVHSTPSACLKKALSAQQDNHPSEQISQDIL